MKPTYRHQEFLTQNTIAIDQLPKLLQKRIHTFSHWTQQLEYVQGKDLHNLQRKIADLDLELEEDLHEHFEDRLSHNIIKAKKVKKTKKIKPPKPTPLPVIAEAKPPELSNEEKLLKGLYDKGNTTGLHRSLLLGLGLPDPKQARNRQFGDYRLVPKGWLTYSYTLIKETPS